MYGCGKLIYDAYTKWNERIIVSFGEETTSVWEIPFPSVTLCPETKFDTAHLNFTAVFNKMSFSGELYNITDKE